jgi:hypothetical protein
VPSLGHRAATCTAGEGWVPLNPKQTQPFALPVVVNLADADAITDAVQRGVPTN